MSSPQAAGPGSGVTGSASPARLAGGLLIGSGLLDVVNAYTETLSDPFVVVTRDGLYRVDITAWAWLNVGIGVALVLTGSLVVTARRGPARFGVALAVLAIAADLLTLPYAPLWVALMVGLNCAAVWLLLRRLRGADDGPAAPGRAVAPVARPDEPS